MGNSPERLIGQNTLACARFIVSENPHITAVHLRAYKYVPNQPSGPQEKEIALPKSEFLRDDIIQSATDNLPDFDWNLSLSSRLTLRDSKTAHLAMMDLAPRKSPENLAKVRQQLTKIVTPHFGGGWILETNKSYQYLGLKILSFEEWLNFLGLNLITSIVTQVDENQPRVHEFVADYRYIGHSLLRRSTGLRITSRGTKAFAPKAIEVI